MCINDTPLVTHNDTDHSVLTFRYEYSWDPPSMLGWEAAMFTQSRDQ